MAYPRQTPHGSLLERKQQDVPALKPCLAAYKVFCTDAEKINVVDDAAVERLAAAYNRYRSKAIYVFEEGKNVPQENLRSTLAEELFGWLFKDIFEILGFAEPINYTAGKTNSSYLNLTFSPKNFRGLFEDPNPRIGKKDQDFAIGATINLAISNLGGQPATAKGLTLPVVAIECKTYLAKNHLDMCSSTAQMLKRANPYCMYLIAAEFLKMDPGVTPEVTDIAEIFVLCKAENAERKKRKAEGKGPHPVYDDVLKEIFRMVIGHLRAVWWDPEKALEQGKVISRPF